MARQPNGNSNLMVSPASLAAVMALLDLGANADMRAGVYKVLGFEEGTPEISADRLAALRATVKLMQSDAEGALTSASSIVFDPAAAPSAQIAAQIADSGAQVTVEYLGDAADTISRINEWVAARTRGLIPSIIVHAPREPGLVALNALHLKDRWKNAFDDSRRGRRRFMNYARALGDVPMMQSEGSLRLREQGAFVAVELPYASDRFRLVVITTKARPAPAAEFSGSGGLACGRGLRGKAGRNFHAALPACRQRRPARHLGHAWSQTRAPLSGRSRRPLSRRR